MNLAPKKAADIVPKGWAALCGDGRLTGGLDIATTQKGTSNPSSFAVLERVGPRYVCRLALAWKTNDPRVTRAVLHRVLADLAERRLRLRRLPVDATSEKYFSADLARELAGRTVVDLIVAAEKTVYRGEEMLFKLYLGNLLVNAFEGGEILIPDAPWIRHHIRQVVREKGSFEAAVDEAGNHADFFDALKLALHGQLRAGASAQAEAAPVGTPRGSRPKKKLPEVFTRFLAGARRAMNP